MLAISAVEYLSAGCSGIFAIIWKGYSEEEGYWDVSFA
jgi:hypothetical protein